MQKKDTMTKKQQKTTTKVTKKGRKNATQTDESFNKTTYKSVNNLGYRIFSAFKGTTNVPKKKKSHFGILNS